MLDLIQGDALTELAKLSAQSVQTCITSPPYYGLRDYGTGEWEGGEDGCDHRPPQGIAAGLLSSTLGGGKKTTAHQETGFGGICGKCGATRIDKQIGLEPNPDAYVAKLLEVFRQVKRVLRDDGTLWLNMGDSYNNRAKTRESSHQPSLNGFADSTWRQDAERGRTRVSLFDDGLKEKDLLGIPWLLAFALRQPYYAGTIRNELDRVWLGAMIEAEGCIYIHRRREGQSNGQGYERKADSFGAGLEVANTSERICQRCLEITGRGSISRQDKDRRQPLYRWVLRTNECREVLREVYPYLLDKQHEVRLACGVPSSGPKATAAWEALKLLHNGGLTDVDFPAPASLHEPGWYLRSEIIWSKLNPMPESVTDRPTKAHETVFLLSKQRAYYYDAEAIREPSVEPWNSFVGFGGAEKKSAGDPYLRTQGYGTFHSDEAQNGRNKRSVWTVATQPYPEAHFATFPPKLIEPMVLAGCPRRCCGICGAPWERIVECEAMVVRPAPKRAGWQATGDDHSRTQLGGTMLSPSSSQTVGLEPSCRCPAVPNANGTPGTVLDPFAGSGTTLEVALKHGRSAIGIELNADYCALARRRLSGITPSMFDVVA